MTTAEPDARPFLKWAGGKQAIAGALIARFPTDYATYFEPFLGGGGVLFAARPTRAICGDANEWLLDCYAAIRDDWRRVAAILDRLPNNRADFLKIRSIPPDSLDRYRRAAHLIYLNKTCFRGLYRVNRRNQFNVPYGAYNRRYYDAETLAAVARCLQGVSFRPGDFAATLDDARAGDFAYLDPPYHKLGGYSDFNRYTQGRFGDDDQERLATVCRDLNDRGVRWAQSNNDTPLIRRLYDGFRMIPVANRREINLNARNRDIHELLILSE